MWPGMTKNVVEWKLNVSNFMISRLVCVAPELHPVPVVSPWDRSNIIIREISNY